VKGGESVGGGWHLKGSAEPRGFPTRKGTFLNVKKKKLKESKHTRGKGGERKIQPLNKGGKKTNELGENDKGKVNAGGKKIDFNGRPTQPVGKTGA